MRIRLRIVVSLCLLLPLTAFAAEVSRGRAERDERPAARHFVLVPQHVLSDAEIADLASSGCVVQRALPNGRYLVLLRNGSSVDASDLRVKSLSAVTAEAKLDTSAYRAAAEAKPFARVKIFFNDDTTFEAACDAVEAAGGALEDPFTLGFGQLRSLRATIPSGSMIDLAASERVYSVYAIRNFRATTYNSEEAAMSNITPLYSAPYNLTGLGVVLSLFELAPAQKDHPEFENRLTVEFTCAPGDSQCKVTDNALHATHVSGTLVAAGINPSAKGMSPKATLHEYEAADPNDEWLGLKDTALKQIGSTADNNSWGYVLGWTPDGTAGWTWNGGDELIGGYDGTLSAVYDHLAITGNTLIVHAAGNEADRSQTGGPQTAPYKHNHVDDLGNATKDIYCYSSNGSGNDCPTPACSAGAAFCETTKHPVHNPYGSVGWTASPKNILAVGAVDFTKTIASFSSRGPTKDGRIKPEVVAKGRNVLSTIPTSSYGFESGTSMATPVVTGSMGLFVEQWRKVFGANTSPAPVVLRALAIAGADDLGRPGPDFDYGFGVLNGKNSVDLIIADGGTGKRIKTDSAANGSRFDYPVVVSSTQDLRVVLSWFDPEALPLKVDQVTTQVLINDLDLSIIDPTGKTVLPYVLDMNNPTNVATQGVNTVDTTEEVEIKGATPGTYHVIVTGKTVTANPPQPFVVISNADITPPPPPCNDPTEPNSSVATAYGPLATNSTTQARICSTDDVDFFRFTPNASGTATVAVRSVDTPMILQIGTLATGSFASFSSHTVSVGTTETVTFAATAGTTYYVSVSLNGTQLGADRGYTLSASYPTTWPSRKRAARR